MCGRLREAMLSPLGSLLEGKVADKQSHTLATGPVILQAYRFSASGRQPLKELAVSSHL
jgi:hypothetical protein